MPKNTEAEVLFINPDCFKKMKKLDWLSCDFQLHSTQKYSYHKKIYIYDFDVESRLLQIEVNVRATINILSGKDGWTDHGIMEALKILRGLPLCNCGEDYNKNDPECKVHGL